MAASDERPRVRDAAWRSLLDDHLSSSMLTTTCLRCGGVLQPRPNALTRSVSIPCSRRKRSSHHQAVGSGKDQAGTSKKSFFAQGEPTQKRSFRIKAGATTLPFRFQIFLWGRSACCRHIVQSSASCRFRIKDHKNLAVLSETPWR